MAEIWVMVYTHLIFSLLSFQHIFFISLHFLSYHIITSCIISTHFSLYSSYSYKVKVKKFCERDFAFVKCRFWGKHLEAKVILHHFSESGSREAPSPLSSCHYISTLNCHASHPTGIFIPIPKRSIFTPNPKRNVIPIPKRSIFITNPKRNVDTCIPGKSIFTIIIHFHICYIGRKEI